VRAAKRDRFVIDYGPAYGCSTPLRSISVQAVVTAACEEVSSSSDEYFLFGRAFSEVFFSRFVA
jgi:hypothetical protein